MPHELGVELADLALDIVGHRCRHHDLAHRGGCRRKRAGVLHVESLEQAADLVAQPVGVAERGVRRRADHEAIGNREPGTAQLSEVRALASGECNVAASELVESAQPCLGCDGWFERLWGRHG